MLDNFWQYYCFFSYNELFVKHGLYEILSASAASKHNVVENKSRSTTNLSYQATLESLPNLLKIIMQSVILGNAFNYWDARSIGTFTKAP